MPSYVVTRRDARRCAGAVIRYQVIQPRFWGASLLAVVVFAVVGGLTHGTGGAILAVLICVLLEAGVVAFKRGQLGKIMAARGYRPGSTITTSFDAETFTIATELGSGAHDYRLVTDARQIGDVVLFRLGAAHMVLALPVEVIPDDPPPAAQQLLSR